MKHKTYLNAERDKHIIYKDNKNKSGIYLTPRGGGVRNGACAFITNKSSIGSAKEVDLAFIILLVLFSVN